MLSHGIPQIPCQGTMPWLAPTASSARAAASPAQRAQRSSCGDTAETTKRERKATEGRRRKAWKDVIGSPWITIEVNDIMIPNYPIIEIHRG